jgi:hypothetical protein
MLLQIYTHEIKIAREKHLPMIEVAPLPVALTILSSTHFDPFANFSNSKTPTGPFQMIVEEERIASINNLLEAGPVSNPNHPAGIPSSTVAKPVYVNQYINSKFGGINIG